MFNCVLSFLVLVVFSAFLNTGSAIRCYNCVSETNSRCLDPFMTTKPGEPPLEMVECTPKLLSDATNQMMGALKSFGDKLGLDIVKGTNHQPPLVCQKLDIMVHGINTTKITHRSCQLSDSTINICEKLESKLNSEGVKVSHCSTCDTDGCNAAPGSVFSSGLPLNVLAITCSFALMWPRFTTLLA